MTLGKAWPDQSGNTGIHGYIVGTEPHAFLDLLDCAYLDYINDPEARPPAAGWVLVDDGRERRDQLGFRGIEKLMTWLHAGIESHLEDADVSARMGATAIALLLDPAGGARDFGAWARDLQKRIQGELFEYGEHALRISTSIGLCQFSRNIPSAEETLLQAARDAEATTSGHPEGDERYLMNLLLEALRADAIKIVFQPLISVSEEDIPRYQVLPRLTGEDGELIPAARFIPIAARHGVLPALDRRMLSRGIGFLENRGAQSPTQLFINQSTALIDDPGLLKWVNRRLEQSPEIARGLVLEFRLGDLLSRLEAARETFINLRDLGIGICVAGADENTSHKVVLDELPCDYIRMAPGFGDRLQAESELPAQFDEFAGKARGDGRKIIIPMLENAESVARVWRANVDLVQGNFIQRPRENLEETAGR